MATFNVRIGNAEYEVDAPDEATAWNWANSSHLGTTETQTALGVGKSDAYHSGQKMPAWQQGMLKAGDVLSFGLAKKMAGPTTTDVVRGAGDQFSEDYPIASLGVNLASAVPQMVLAPELFATKAIGPAASVAEKAMQSPYVRSSITGGIEGGLAGIGNSEDMTSQGTFDSAMKGAIGGAVMAPAAYGGGKVLGMATGAGARAGARAVAPTAAEQFANVTPAQRRLALELSRSMPEGFQGSPAEYAIGELRRLGPEGMIADVSPNTIRLADLMATMPGRAKSEFENIIEQRQAGRGSRIMSEVQNATGKPNAGFSETLQALNEKKLKESAPFYAALQYAKVPADDELLSLLKSAGVEALGKSRRLARLAGEDPISLKGLEDARDVITNAVIPGKQLDFKALDHVKQALYDLETKFGRAGEKQESAAFGNLRKRLTAKLDEVSPKDDAGMSIYAKARNAYAGPAQMEDALEIGRKAFTEDFVGLSDVVDAMSESERNAFQIGAIQALRQKVGTESGQTSLLKEWKESKTSNVLKKIFGNDYDAFSSALKNERQLKQFESVGRGSQTAPRLAGKEDLDVEPVLEGAKAIASGSPWALLGGVSRAMKGAATPEPIRNQIARILSQRGTSAEEELKMLDAVLRQSAAKRGRGAALAGALSSMAATE